MYRLISSVVDGGEFFEVKPHWGTSVITALARVDGLPIGIVANNPLKNGGALDRDGSDKQTHFLELCNYFHIPIVYLVDVPGFMIGEQAEQEGTLRSGMRAVWVGLQATVPQLTIVIRKCYGMAGMATGNPRRLNYRLGWPSGEWGSIPIEGGVDAAYRREIANAEDPDAKREEIEADLRQLRNVFLTAETSASRRSSTAQDAQLPPAVRRASLQGPPPRTGVEAPLRRPTLGACRASDENGQAGNQAVGGEGNQRPPRTNQSSPRIAISAVANDTTAPIASGPASTPPPSSISDATASTPAPASAGIDRPECPARRCLASLSQRHPGDHAHPRPRDARQHRQALRDADGQRSPPIQPGQWSRIAHPLRAPLRPGDQHAGQQQERPAVVALRRSSCRVS